MGSDIPLDQWWLNPSRVFYKEKEYRRFVPYWLQTDSDSPVGGGWLKALELPISNICAGDPKVGPRVLMPHALRAMRQYFNRRSMTRVWEGFGLLFPPEGQLKNLFVALATIKQIEIAGRIRVMLAGSHSNAPSGMWHEVFCYFLLILGFSGDVDAYDPSQPILFKKYSYEGRVISFSGIGSKVPESERGQSYDVVIDDIFAGGPGTFAWQSKYWSQKDHSGVGPTFFHDTEGRIFSHGFTLRPKMQGCCCGRCSFEALLGLPIETVTALTSQVERHKCVSQVDLAFIAKLRMNVESLPVTEVRQMAEVRAALAISKVTPLKALTPERLQLGERNQILDFTRTYGFAQQKGDPPVSVDYFHNKTVHFFGVSPTILGNTMLRRGVVADVGFFSDDPLIYEVIRVKEAFISGVYSQPGFRATGRYYGKYVSYKRVLDVYRPQIVPIVEEVLSSNVVIEGHQITSQPVDVKLFCLQLGLDCAFSRLKIVGSRVDLTREIRQSERYYCLSHRSLHKVGTTCEKLLPCPICLKQKCYVHGKAHVCSRCSQVFMSRMDRLFCWTCLVD